MTDKQAKYRLTLLEGVGKEVLKDILIDLCHIGQYLNTEKEVIEYNIGVAILSNCGVFCAGNDGAVVDALCNVVPPPETTAE
jgi:hypothetical protein